MRRRRRTSAAGLASAQAVVGLSAPGRVLHVFPYDPRHLGQGFERWAASQLERWPLAAVRRSALAGRSSVHVLGPARRRMPAEPLEIVEHRSLSSGPRYRDWGDDWSLSLGRTLRRLRADDVCVIHLNDYAAARLVQRVAWRSRVVIVFHGRGLGRFDEHLATADRLVVLRADAADQLRADGAAPTQVALVAPSVDRERFFPAASDPAPEPVRLGFIGRLERSKGVLDIPPLISRLAAEGIPARAELVGPFDAEQRAAFEQAAAGAGVRDRIELLGELPGALLATRMREWRALLLPSYTEGHPLVALEACATRLPVAAVAGVLPAELEARPCVRAAPREHYAETVLALLRADRRPPAADWVRSHEQAAAEWDALLEGLPPWRTRPRLRVSRRGRARRLRPLRRAARALLRRGR